MTDVFTDVLSSRAREAPTTVGVYFIVGAEGELLYIGKAANLNRRLRDHARKDDGSPIWRRVPSAVQDVRWIECADEREATCREADLIIALRPTFNKSMTDKDSFVNITVERVESSQAGSQLRFCLMDKDPGGATKSYGSFPQLGKGKASWPAVRSNAGYAALLRLIWVAFSLPDAQTRIPSRLHGSSPPVDHTTSFDPRAQKALHGFMSGTSKKWLTALHERLSANESIAYMHPALVRDLTSAAEFFDLGPRALRAFRLKHGLPAGVVDRETQIELLRQEVQEAIGDVALASSRTRRLARGRTTRSVELREARRRLDSN